MRVAFTWTVCAKVHKVQFSTSGADGRFGAHEHYRSYTEVRHGAARWTSRPARDKSHTLGQDKQRIVRRLTSEKTR